jgi:hypothetical protein
LFMLGFIKWNPILSIFLYIWNIPYIVLVYQLEDHSLMRQISKRVQVHHVSYCSYIFIA